MRMVRRLARAQESPYYHTLSEQTLNVTFQNHVVCPNVFAQGSLCDMGMGFEPRPGLGYGWQCDNRTFHHVEDGFIWEGVFFDGSFRCDGNVTWLAEVSVNGLYHVHLTMNSFSTHLTRGRWPCFLNGYQIAGPEPIGLMDKVGWSANYEVLVVDNHLRIGGKSMACGALRGLVMHKLRPPVANTDCWNYAGFEYHLCCTEHDASKRFQHCFDGQVFTFDNCCRIGRAAVARVALPAPEDMPSRACFFPHCQRQCLGPGPNFYAAAPRWVEQAAWPAPLICEGIPLYPLTYAIPLELMVDCIPPKYTDFAMTWPGDVTTYLVKGSLDPAVAIPEYFRMYQEAMFAMTMRKSGNDAARHVEILASGAVPWMPDVALINKHSMPHHRKELLAAALDLPGVSGGELQAEEFNATAYMALAQDHLMWTRHRLSTKAVADYFLAMLGLGPSQRRTARFLFLMPAGAGKPLQLPAAAFMLLHGLRHVLGGRRVVDFPMVARVYEPPPGRPIGQAAGEPGDAHGFILARWRLPRVSLDRRPEVLRHQIAEGHFSHAIYGYMHPSDLDAEILAHIPRERLVAVKGFDHMPTCLLPWARFVGTMFGYNLEDKCPQGVEPTDCRLPGSAPAPT